MVRKNRRQLLRYGAMVGALAALGAIGPGRGVSTSLAAGASSALQAPVLPFPATAVLDNFNRGNGPVSPLGPNWSGFTGGSFGTDYFRIDNNAVQCVSTGWMYWNSAIFGANQEAYFTFRKVPTAHQNILLKRLGPSAGANPASSLIDFHFQSDTNQFQIWTSAPDPQGWLLRATLDNVFMQPGDQHGARAYADGTLEQYKNGVLLLSTNVATGPNPWPLDLLTGGGQVGVWYNAIPGNFAPPNDAMFDDFGGGNIP